MIWPFLTGCLLVVVVTLSVVVSGLAVLLVRLEKRVKLGREADTMNFATLLNEQVKHRESIHDHKARIHKLELAWKMRHGGVGGD